MNKVIFNKTLVLVTLVSLIFSGCKKDDDDSGNADTSGTLRLMVDNRAMDLSGTMVDLALDTFGYKTPEGDTISFDHIKYFISDVKLITANDDTVSTSGVYWLKKQDSDNGSYRAMLDIDGVEPGTYSKLYFAVGVDQNCNTVTACTTGDLDPFSTDPEKMIWDWASNSGYKFLRTEGDFKGNNTSTTGAQDGSFSFHIGSNSNYKDYALTSADPIVISDDKMTMVHIMCMTNQIFTSPNSIDLEATSSQGTAGAGNIADNYASGMFMLHHVNDPM